MKEKDDFPERTILCLKNAQSIAHTPWGKAYQNMHISTPQSTRQDICSFCFQWLQGKQGVSAV